MHDLFNIRQPPTFSLECLSLYERGFDAEHYTDQC